MTFLNLFFFFLPQPISQPKWLGVYTLIYSYFKLCTSSVQTGDLLNQLQVLVWVLLLLLLFACLFSRMKPSVKHLKRLNDQTIYLNEARNFSFTYHFIAQAHKDWLNCPQMGVPLEMLKSILFSIQMPLQKGVCLLSDVKYVGSQFNEIHINLKR